MPSEKNLANCDGQWKKQAIAAWLLIALCASSCKAPLKVEQSNLGDTLHRVDGYALMQQPVPPSIATTTFPAGTLKAIPVGTGFSFRSGQATVSVKRLTGDSIQATATCDSLARQVILLSRELARVSRQTTTTVSQVPPQVIRQPSAWQWFWIRTGQIAVAALLLILIKRRLF